MAAQASSSSQGAPILLPSPLPRLPTPAKAPPPPRRRPKCPTEAQYAGRAWPPTKTAGNFNRALSPLIGEADDPTLRCVSVSILLEKP